MYSLTNMEDHTMIRNSTARQLLYAWHGGMSSAFYAAASSGLVAMDPGMRGGWDDLFAEHTRCYHPSNTPADNRQLHRLIEWLQHQRNASTLWVNHPTDGHTYAALPWSKRT